jgi:hypothetical protein
MINSIYTDYYLFRYDDSPNARANIFMKYQGLALDVGTAGGLAKKCLMADKPIRAFIRLEAHEIPGYRNYGKLRHLNFFGAHIHGYNWYKPWTWWK